MFKYFDYLFYRVCEYYKKSDEDGYRFSAALVLAVLQGFNVASVFFYVQILMGVKIKLGTVHAVSYAALFFIINLMRYKKDKYDIESLKEKWKYETKSTRNRKLNVIILYIVLSIILLLILVNYHGRKDW